MDSDILKKSGVHPRNLRTAYLENYELIIGERASLIPREDERAYGILMELENEEIDVLYSEPSVADYKPEKVEVIVESGIIVSANCYNLPKEAISGTNKEYARKLLELATRLGFPKEYLIRIKEMGLK